MAEPPADIPNLTIYQLFILSRMATAPAATMPSSPRHFTQSTQGLLEMAVVWSLARAGLLEMRSAPFRWALSPKGEAALRWWHEGLADLVPYPRDAQTREASPT